MFLELDKLILGPNGQNEYDAPPTKLHYLTTYGSTQTKQKVYRYRFYLRGPQLEHYRNFSINFHDGTSRTWKNTDYNRLEFPFLIATIKAENLTQTVIAEICHKDAQLSIWNGFLFSKVFEVIISRMKTNNERLVMFFFELFKGTEKQQQDIIYEHRQIIQRVLYKLAPKIDYVCFSALYALSANNPAFHKIFGEPIKRAIGEIAEKQPQYAFLQWCSRGAFNSTI